MLDVDTTTAVLIDLYERLGLVRTEADTACGEVESYPTTMTALGGDPRAIAPCWVIWHNWADAISAAC